MVAIKTRLLDPVVVPAYAGYDVVRLQLKPGVQLANARDLEDVIEVVEPIVAWVTQVAVFDEGITKGTPQSASVIPISSYGMVDASKYYLIRFPNGNHDMPGVFTGKEHRDAIRQCLVVMRQK